MSTTTSTPAAPDEYPFRQNAENLALNLIYLRSTCDALEQGGTLTQEDIAWMRELSIQGVLWMAWLRECRRTK